MLHTPKNPYCFGCLTAKLYQQQACATRPGATTIPEEFGDWITADHVILQKEDDVGRMGERAGIMCTDAATDIIHFEVPPEKSRLKYR